MSIEAINWALDLPHKNATHKVVLIGLANHANPDGGDCYPSIARLETYTGLHKRSIVRAIAQMEELGIISAIHEMGKKTRYTLRLTRQAVSERHRCQRVTGDTAPPDRWQSATRTGDTAPPKPSLTISEPSDDIARVGFERFYSAYPRKKGRQHAERAYALALKKAAHEDLLTGAQRYAASVEGTDPKFIKHPATWLNGGCWADEPDVHTPAKSNRGGSGRSAAMEAMLRRAQSYTPNMEDQQ